MFVRLLHSEGGVSACNIQSLEELQEGVRRGLAEIITDFPETCSRALYKILTRYRMPRWSAIGAA
jgi:hypothetical protein